jgi:hypothetical protein
MDEAQGLLRRWLGTRDDGESAYLLAELITEHVEPVIRRVVGLRVGRFATEYDDICQSALKSVLGKLVALKGEAAEDSAMENLCGYAAVVAFRAADEYGRTRSPAWSKIAGRLRYALRAPDLAEWSVDGKDVCGFATQRGAPPSSLSDDDAAVHRAVSQAATSQKEFGEAVRVLFRANGAPILFTAAVTILTRHFDVPLRTRLEGAGDEEDRVWEKLAGREPSIDVQTDRVLFLERLWIEIRALPLDQRRALLLNLEGADGGDIQLFEWLGVASIRDIAAVLEMDAEAFAALWNELPLDDLRIAEIFGINRQRVINLRSSARKRLLKRTKQLHEAI